VRQNGIWARQREIRPQTRTLGRLDRVVKDNGIGVVVEDYAEETAVATVWFAEGFVVATAGVVLWVEYPFY
jgi:hypothetical protein